jgi:hypothetical protein
VEALVGEHADGGAEELVARPLLPSLEAIDGAYRLG